MAFTGRRSEEGKESSSSYELDPSSHNNNSHQYERHRHPPQQHNMIQHQHQHQIHNNPYSQTHSYSHEQFINGERQMQMPLLKQHPPYHQNGSANGNDNGNYNNTNYVPVPPRRRMRKWSDMTRTIWHYERIEQIGEGTYGQVYRARCKDTNEIVAMKKIRVHHGAHWGMPPTVIREIKILKRLVHPNLVRMYEVVSSKGVEHLDPDDYHKGSDRSRKNKKQKSGGGQGGAENNNNDREGNNDSNRKQNDTNKNSNSKQIDISDAREGYKGNLFLVLEYVPHDLTGLLDVAYRFSEVEIKCVFRQLLEALRYMHDQKYVHRDIKSSNILIDRNFRLKLADFGLARSIEPPLLDNLHDRSTSQEFTNKVITLWYRPPELLLGATRYGFAVDIWSAGCILAELVLGRPIFTGKTEMDQLQHIFDLVGTPTAKSWPGVNELKLLRTGDVSIDSDTDRKRPKLRERYETKMNNNAPWAINLVEKLLELDPSKRPTATRALNHRYFLQEPRAPDQPEALGEMKLAEGGSFHEFQTKKKRKEAKIEAEKIKQAALDGGHSSRQAQEEYDACYRGIMEKIAREGLKSSAADAVPAVVDDVTGANAANENEANAKSGDGERHEDRHGERHPRSSRSDRSSRDKEKDHYRESSSRGRDRRSRERERSGGGGSSRHDNDRERRGDKDGHKKTRDETGGDNHRDHGRERSRSSRRNSESDDRKKKRRRDSSGEDIERSTSDRRDKDKESRQEHREESKEESGANANEINKKSENRAERTNSTIERSKEEKLHNEGIGTDDKQATKQLVQNNHPSEVDDSAGTNIDNKSKGIPADTLQSQQEKTEKEPSRENNSVTDKPDEKKDSKPDKLKEPEKEHHSRSLISSGDRKRSDRSRDRARDDGDRRDRRDRGDRDHRRRSSRDKDGRSRDGDRDRSSSRRSSSDKRRKSSRARSRSRSIERDESSRKNRDDRDHRHRREKDHQSRRNRDRDRERERRFHHDDLREMDRRARDDRHLHHDDLGPDMGGVRGPPLPVMQRRGGNPDFNGGPPHHHPRGGDFGPYGSGGGDRGPPPRGEGHGGGGYHGPPGRHSGGGGNRAPPHGGGRHPMDYYPPGGDQPPPGFRDRDRDQSRRRDRDRDGR